MLHKRVEYAMEHPVELTFGDFMEVDEPFGLFDAWFKAAKAREPRDPDAAALATVDSHGLPNVRMVLIKAPLAQIRETADDNAPVVFQFARLTFGAPIRIPEFTVGAIRLSSWVMRLHERPPDSRPRIGSAAVAPFATEGECRERRQRGGSDRTNPWSEHGQGS